MEVRLAADGQYSYKYNKDEYAVTTATNGSTFEIKAADIRAETGNGSQTNVIVYIPNQSYTLITGVSTGSSLILPAINVNITVTSNVKKNTSGIANNCIVCNRGQHIILNRYAVILLRHIGLFMPIAIFSGGNSKIFFKRPIKVRNIMKS